MKFSLTPLTFSVLIFVTIGTVFTIILFDYGSSSKSGSVVVGNVSSYGFGADKRLLIIDLTDIGSADDIHPSNKQFAILTWGDKDGVQTSPIGLEIKGTPRTKLNLAFEFWMPPDCTSIDTCDDEKYEMYDFGEKYEDYVLNGAYHEPTFVRDDLASKLIGGIMKKIFVEVLFKINDKYTYEGVYLLGPAIQRRFLEKTLEWDASGKKKDCDDYNPEKVGYMFEYTLKVVNLKSSECPIFKNNIKMKYPKCDFYDEEEIKPCRAAYVTETRSHVNTISSSVINTSTIDLTSFANTYMIEMLMRDPDFPYGSQYFYVDPDTGILHSGPRWDYDRPHWRATANSWDIIDHYSYLFFYNKPAPIWMALGKNEMFINKVKELKANIAANNAIAQQVIHERKGQLAAGYFDRELVRWKSFGKLKELIYTFWELGTNLKTESTPMGELNAMLEYFDQRTLWMLTHVGEFNGFGVTSASINVRSLLALWPLWTTFLVTIVIIIIQSCKRRASALGSAKKTNSYSAVKTKTTYPTNGYKIDF